MAECGSNKHLRGWKKQRKITNGQEDLFGTQEYTQTSFIED